MAFTTMTVKLFSIHEIGVALEMRYTTVTVSNRETSSSPSSTINIVVEAWVEAGVLLIRTGGVTAVVVSCAVVVSVAERLPPPQTQQAVLAV